MNNKIDMYAKSQGTQYSVNMCFPNQCTRLHSCSLELRVVSFYEETCATQCLWTMFLRITHATWLSSVTEKGRERQAPRSLAQKYMSERKCS